MFYEYYLTLNDLEETRAGVTYAENIGDATENIAAFYGESNIAILELTPLYDEPFVYELASNIQDLQNLKIFSIIYTESERENSFQK